MTNEQREERNRVIAEGCGHRLTHHYWCETCSTSAGTVTISNGVTRCSQCGQCIEIRAGRDYTSNLNDCAAAEKALRVRADVIWSADPDDLDDAALVELYDADANLRASTTGPTEAFARSDALAKLCKANGGAT